LAEAIEIKILVLGASGVVGFHIAQGLSEKHAVVRASRNSPAADIHSDLSREDGILCALSCKPDAVVNAVKPALSVDEMETKRTEAYALNTLLPERLAKLQPEYGFLLVQASTDGVYAGRPGETYSELSPVEPPNYYCHTKALAEEKIIEAAGEYIILRTEGVFGYDEKGTNFFLRMAGAEKAGKGFSAASDQFSQPICGLELARLATALIEKKKRGVYNACGPDLVSRHGLALLMKKQMGWGLRIGESSIKGRAAKVQPCLRVDISKMERDAGRVSSLPAQMAELRRWMNENKH